MFDSTVAEHYPRPLPGREESNVQGYAAAQQVLFDELDDDLEYVIASHQVERARGEDLDQIGARFGQLGRRYGRGDGSYQRYLKSVVNSYAGVGTINDITIAVAGAVDAAPEAVAVREDYTTNEYGLTIHEWGVHETDLVAQLADLADPSCVERTGAMEYVLGAGRVGVTGEGVESVQRIVHARPGRVGVTGGAVDPIVTDSTGFGAGNFAD